MASIFRRKNRKGRPAKTYSIKYKDEHGKWRTAKGNTDRDLTRKKAAMIEHDVECRRRGLVDPFEAPRQEPLKEHVAAYRRYLEGKANCPDHVERTFARINSVFDGCGFTRIDDLRAYNATDRAGAYLQQRRADKEKPISAHTSNHYLTAVKGFCRWAAQQGRMPPSPLTFLKKISTEADKPRQRRAANAKEFGKLFKAAQKGPMSYGLSGEQRAWLYMVAADTGLRAGELASLRPCDFRLTADPAHILVRASISKNGKQAKQPVRMELVRMLADWLSIDRPDERVWPGNWFQRAAEMLQVDLKAAKVACETAEGVLDFHALRATFITGLVRAGVNLKAVQNLARHSEISLTLRQYTKLTDRENADALDSLPPLPRMKGAPRAHQTSDRLSHIVSAPVRSLRKAKQPQAAGLQRLAAAG